MYGPILVALGSNSDAAAALRRAVDKLAERGAVRAASRVYESVPLDADGQVIPGGAPYLNAAVWIETDLPPAALKFDVLRPVEAALGRVRPAPKNAPVPIDLDLVIYGGLVLNDPVSGLVLPDPDIAARAYLALPLADLAPDFVHPLTGETLAALAAQWAGATGIRARADVTLWGG